MKLLKLLLAIGIIVTMSFADVVVNSTNFPDPGFREWIKERGWMTGDKITSKQISEITELDFSDEFLFIQNVKGIEFFTNAKRINFSRIDIFEIDLSGNNNHIEKVVIEDCMNLASVKANNTLIDTLFIWLNWGLHSVEVTNNTRMKKLFCSVNENLLSIDASNNPIINEIVCDQNELGLLNVKGCPAVTNIVCHYNKLTAIDLSDNTNLIELVAYENKLTSIDLSKNTNLRKIFLNNNRLTVTDVANNTSLFLAHINEQKPTVFMHKDGANWSATVKFNIGNYPPTFPEGVTYNESTMKLTSTNSSSTSITGFDAMMNYNGPGLQPLCLGCDYGMLGEVTLVYLNSLNPGEVAITPEEFPDETFREYIKDNLDKNSDGILSTAEIALVKRLDIDYQTIYKYIYDLTGIKYFTALEWLNCRNQALNSIDLSNNKALRILYAFNNIILKSVNVSQNLELDSLEIGAEIAALDVTNITKLRCLMVSGGSLSSIDLSKNAKLEYLYLTDLEEVMTLDLSNNPELQRIIISDIPKLSSINLTKNQKLTELSLCYSGLSSLDVTNNSELTFLRLDDNKLTALDVTKNIKLTRLMIGNYRNPDDNKITEIDLSKNTDLQHLSAPECGLKTLDLTNNTKLVELYIWGNHLYSIDLSKNPRLAYYNMVDQIVHVSVFVDVHPQYSGDILLNNPVFSNNQVNYAEGKISTSYGNYETDFEVETGLAGKKLSGILSFVYHIPGVDCEETEWEITTPATCVADGVESEFCSVCGEPTGATRPIAKLGHDESGAGATCTSDKICLRDGCGVVLVPALGHDFTAFGSVIIQGNCETGTPTIVKAKCSRCGIEHETYVLLAPCDYDSETPCAHDFSEHGSVITQGDCDLGTPTIVRAKCSLCGIEDMTGIHTFEEVCDYVPTPDSDCKHDYSATGELYSAATCTMPAFYKVKCSICGEVHAKILKVAGEPLGHDFSAFGSTIVQGNCETETPTFVKAKCSRCGIEHVTYVLQAPCDYDEAQDSDCIHDFSEYGSVVIQGDCDLGTPTIVRAKCSLCGVESENILLEAPCDYDEVPDSDCKHDYSVKGSVVFQGDCEKGIPTIYRAKCSICGEEHETLMIMQPCLETEYCEHVFDAYGDLHSEATCETAALYKAVCSICGLRHSTLLLSKGDALGHKFSFKVTLQPNCQIDGEETEICNVCGAIGDTKPISSHIVALVKRWDNVLTIVNNSANNGGFKFDSFEWYKVDESTGKGIKLPIIGQSTTGNNLKTGYYFAIVKGKDKNGNTVEFRTCEEFIGGETKTKASAVIVKEGNSLYIQATDAENCEVEVFNTVGDKIAIIGVSGNITQIAPQLATQGYLFMLKDKNGVKTIIKKVMVK